MAGNSATLRFDIVGNGKDAQRAAKRTGAAYDRMGRRVGGVGQAANRSQSKVRRLGGAFASAAKRFGPLAAAAAGYAILKFGTDSIRAASDVQQAFGAIDSVFGKNAATVKAWAESAAVNVGLAKSEYANLAVVLGSMLKNTGIEDYSLKTKNLIKLGADLAATFGGTTKQAVEALGSTLRGEYDPLEQYGVSIKQSDVNARLAAKGLGKLTGKALKTAEQTARLKLIFEQTTKAQGAFSRESGTLAHKQQVLAAKFENVKATLGKKLLPVAVKVTEWLTDTVSGTNDTSRVLKALGTMIRDYLRPWLKKLRKAFDEVTDALDAVDGKSDGTADTWNDLYRIGRKLSQLFGVLGGNNLILLAKGFGIATRAASFHWRSLAKVYDWAQWAAGAIDDLYDKLGALSAFGGLGGLVSDLIRSGDPNLSGLARAGGAGRTGLSVSAPRVNVTSSPNVTVMLDGRALDKRFVRVFHDELDSVGVSIRRGA